MKYIYRILISSLIISLTACEDWFDIRPKSETIFEDYWNYEDDVLSVVGSCYRIMNEPEFMERLIVWGELRSDNVIGNSNVNDDIKNILELNLTATTSYTKWEKFYTAINYCNTVIENAPIVRDRDPNFTENELNAYIAEVKGLRALLYFHLVRAFRDIPLITKGIIDDTAPMEVAQSDPDYVIDYLIKDLRSVEENAVSAWGRDDYTKGRITRNAIRTIIADMYLWRNNYDSCVIYCDKVLDDRTSGLTLESSSQYNRNVFIQGNSTESIFELQFDEGNIANYVINEMYGVSGGRAGVNVGQLIALDFSPIALFGPTDLRGKDAFYYSEGAAIFPIKKYIAYRVETSSSEIRLSDYRHVIGPVNWIFYRLSDIYLMKAEALVERARGTDLSDALGLVSKTYDRANPDLPSGSLNPATYASQEAMRNLVFDERQREFIFEGKRYYDLLRRINREGLSNIVTTYLMKKYTKLDPSTARSKLSDINALYVPINQDELKLNSLLKQNKFYETNSNSGRN